MRTHVIQTSFLSGVLSPEAASRVDTDAYNQGLLEGVNIVPRPLGGVRRRPGLRYVDRLPNVLSRLTSGISITTPNGGTGANANDGSTATLLTTTTNVSTVDPYVVVQYDLGSAQTVVFADVLEIASTGGSSLQFVIQYSADGVAWGNVGDAFELVDPTARSYRRRCPLTAYRYWRVVKTGGTDMGAVTISLQEFNLWAETSTISAVRLIPFEVDTDTQYLVAFTDRSMAIYQNGALVVRLPSPYASADLAVLDAAQSQDSLVVVHPDHAPRFVYPELGTIYSDPIVFDEIPQYDFDDTSSPTPTSEIQVLTFTGWSAGETYQLELEGARTGALTYAGDGTALAQATNCDDIAREIQKLYSVPGFTGVSCARTGANQYTVTFADASAKDYKALKGVPLTGTNAIGVSQTQAGVPRTEDAWSATRGYPRTVTFFEGRLYFGGTRSLPVAIIGSKVNQILAFEIEEAFDDDAIFVLLNGQQLNAVQALYASRVLQVFTSGGEMRYAKEQGVPVTPRDVPAMQTQYGSARIRPVAIDGTTVFIQRTGKAVRDFRYDYEEDAYNSLGISALAPHLINNVVGLTAWNGSSTDEINLVFVVNADGTVAVLTSRREASVRAWVQWTTQGSFRAAAGMLEDTYFAVQRTIDTTDYLFLEVTDPDYYLDCAVQTSLGGGSTVTGLSHLNGAECRVRADGYVLADVTPAGGSATLVEGAFDAVEVGLGFNPTITPMPLNQMLPEGANFMRKRRLTKVRVKLYETLGLRVNGRVIPDIGTDVDNMDAAAVPFSGIRSIEETTNWDEDEDKVVTFSQVDPLPMTILGIDITLEGNE